MNNNSLICEFISNNKDWEKRLTDEYLINICIDGSLAIFNYGAGSDFSLPLVREARGIIIDLDSLNVVCWPFNKFGNWNEAYADDIDWNYAVARQKIDGSLIKLFWNPTKNIWQWSTNKTIDAAKASASENNINYLDIIQSSDNYKDVDYDSLNKDYTYLFELVSPITPVVIMYHKTHLYHIGTRNNITGKELNTNIGIEQPMEFKVSDLESILEHANTINPDDIVTEEGYVVVDKDFNRIKIKSPKYLLMHATINNHVLTKKRIVNDIFLEKNIDTQDCRMVAKYKYYEYKIAELKMMVQMFIDYVKMLYEEVSQDRYAVYEAIKNHPLAQFGLKAIENDECADVLIKNMYASRRDGFLRLLPDYNITYDNVIKGEIFNE